MYEDDGFDRLDAARALGHDLYTWSGRVDDAAPLAVRDGFAEAKVHGVQRRRADRFVRKWLQIRCGALARGRVVVDDVTPELLRDLDVERCPVTRVTLTHGERCDTDWSIDRINNDGAYAANNLAVMSTRANRAKGHKGFEEVLALSGRPSAADGLERVEWLRLAALMLGPCFVARQAFAPLIPLAAPIPCFAVRPGYQQIQLAFTQGAQLQSGKNALVKAFRPACRNERAMARLRVFAESMHQGLKTVADGHDAWLDAELMAAFSAWRDSLDAPERLLAARIAVRLLGARPAPLERIATWQLDNRGYQRGTGAGRGWSA